jgi:hypothetical protein
MASFKRSQSRDNLLLFCKAIWNKNVTEVTDAVDIIVNLDAKSCKTNTTLAVIRIVDINDNHHLGYGITSLIN